MAQTFFVDDDMQSQFKLDGIITLIDVKQVSPRIDDSAECKEQIAFGDVIVLNKSDLVSEEDLNRPETRIRSMNALARIDRTTNAALPIEAVLNVGGFDLDRAPVTKPTFLETEYPFECGVSKLLREQGTDIFRMNGACRARQCLDRTGRPPAFTSPAHSRSRLRQERSRRSTAHTRWLCIDRHRARARPARASRARAVPPVTPPRRACPGDGSRDPPMRAQAPPFPETDRGVIFTA